jgi:hypothetical protein
MLKLLLSRWVWTSLIIILVITVIVFIFNSKFIVDNFVDLDLSCDAIQNKYYHTEELLHKSQCPNLVILEKLINGTTAFFVEQGDHNGPYFSQDYIRYYHMGVSPDGIILNLEYDLYYYPWYNPRRWFHGAYGYYPRRRAHWRRDLYDKWDDYSKRLDRRMDRRMDRINKRMDKLDRRIPGRPERPERPERPINRSISNKPRSLTRSPISPAKTNVNKNKGTMLGASARL